MSLCAVIAFRKHFKKPALFVFVFIVAICANIFIPAFEFFVRSEPQNDRILDYISQNKNIQKTEINFFIQ